MAIVAEKQSHRYCVTFSDGGFENMNAGRVSVDERGTLTLYDVVYYRDPAAEKRWLPPLMMLPPPRYTPFRWFAAGTWKEAVMLSDSAEEK
ncbi:hypothetical protein FHT87_005175 [Rhizobium sp. BK316]|uniref:hypothetical protein n=1 Tax=Rhizobium sp. BK316 TaxID=2587053 RepID=UPI001621C6DC|nr:hypothetical protein [Rhizobium sp. BK316]MBB3411222.1 hypothetical protein [Rhizobium sp. BK316]